jgi:hypothetical protein
MTLIDAPPSHVLQRVSIGVIFVCLDSSHTPVANIAVGAYEYGMGLSPGAGSLLSSTFATLFSKNGPTAQQAQFRNVGFDLASGKATYTCQSHP